jgi:hypothetical protein
MSVGVFTDKAHQPTEEEMLAAIGARRSLWEQLILYLRESYRCQEDVKFYGKNLGWAVRFRKGGIALVSLYPGADEFTAQLILGASLTEKALATTRTETARQALETAHLYPEGRWLFVRIESEAELGDVQQLLALKVRPAAKGPAMNRPGCGPAAEGPAMNRPGYSIASDEIGLKNDTE